MEYTLRRGAFKNAAIRISKDGRVSVTAPYFWTNDMITNLLSSKYSWIEKQLIKIKKLSETQIKVPDNCLLYLGEIYTLKRNISMGRFYNIDEQNKIIATGKDLTMPSNLKQFYKERSSFILPERVRLMAEKYGFSYTSANVRDTKRRWGSCTSKGVITLSCRLIATPLFVIDAIALHELVHTVIMNHSSAFYTKLENVCSFYKEADIWLKEKYPINYPPEKKGN